jgi:hypothetical protein
MSTWPLTCIGSDALSIVRFGTKFCVISLLVEALLLQAARPIRAAETEKAAPVVEISPFDARGVGSEVHVGPPPVPPRRAGSDPDAGLGGKQVGVGLLTVVGASLIGAGLIWGADAADSPRFSPVLAYGGAAAVLLAPAGVGIAVCKVGESSKRYDGRCFPSVGGAYIGALGVIPGTVLGALAACTGSSSAADDNPDDHVNLAGLDECVTGAAIGGALGYTIGTLIGAYSGWSIFKRPKPGTLRAALF